MFYVVSTVDQVLDCILLELKWAKPKDQEFLIITSAHSRIMPRITVDVHPQVAQPANPNAGGRFIIHSGMQMCRELSLYPVLMLTL